MPQRFRVHNNRPIFWLLVSAAVLTTPALVLTTVANLLS